MAITLELKLSLSNFSRVIEEKRGYQGTDIDFSRVQWYILLIHYFWLIFANFQKEADCLSFNSVTDRDPKWSFLCRDVISGFYYRIQVKFLKSIQWSHFYGSLNVYTFLTHPVLCYWLFSFQFDEEFKGNFNFSENIMLWFYSPAT